MKRMKKAAALLLTLMMTLSLTVTAFAADKTVPKDYFITNGVSAKGTITINNLHLDSAGESDTKYDVYKMLHLESYQPKVNAEDKDAYSYVMVEGWESFFGSDVAQKYIKFNASGYAEWHGAQDQDSLNEFAAAALAYAKANSITPIMTTDTTYVPATDTGYDPGPSGSTTGIFHGLPLGYYLIDSNVGILCGLTTTNPNANVYAKNGAPTLQKQVQEDSAASSGTASWFDSNTADIGQTVKFDVTVNTYAGAENYVFHDKMSAGLTYVPSSLVVTHYDPTTDVSKTLSGADYTTTYADCAEGCTFHIVFTPTFLETLKTNDKIYVTYEAVLNKDAVVGGTGNTNTVWLAYGENHGHETTPDQTTTYTYGFDLVKTDSADKLLAGAQFQLYTHATQRTDEYRMKFVYDSVNDTYRLATASDASPMETLLVNDGMISISGLDNGRYYLVETKAPTGYNKLETPVEVTISDAYRDAVVTGDTLTGGTNPVQIINNTGALLPHTGGMGTTLFITCGMIAVLGAGVLLVTKKRMGMIED